VRGGTKPKRVDGRRGTKGNRGGGRKLGSVTVTGGRPFVRSLVDNPANRKLVAKAFARALRGTNAAEAVAAWDRMFQAAYGRPPQALDVRTADVTPGEQVIYRAVVAGLDSAEFEGLPGSDVPLGGTD